MSVIEGKKGGSHGVLRGTNFENLRVYGEIVWYITRAHILHGWPFFF
jgi:hypothetical protein